MAWPFSPASPPAVRPLRTADAPAVAALHREGFHTGWSVAECEAMLVDPAILGQAIGAGTAVDGFVLSRMAADEAEILTIAVARKRRGGGWGRKLLQAHLGALSGRGVRQLFLEVDEGNAPARALYARVGFEQVGRRQGYYRKPDGSVAAALVLRRALD
ncbi:ribosomal-protein-alanine N-acetyltransferase RimI [Alsobacter soli]|uniref:Ribosomal-protein-alanine N-acetyltransferase RimI n=1 Tax=Alsobacter soli TaxID=2109933 RepID=A0A2T1HT84_9HYPH|nr:GNAT family N-acetyltransferase [Alsobacter soli]PSC04818.1 ribosomal-protein-alanine N-acetyltransferase RimI [Alsobacter soli]